MMAEGERLLYPCYFNATLTRAEGRRIARSQAAKNPALADLERALRRMKLTFRSEQQHHPAHWWKHEGRVVVFWKGRSKEDLIREVAHHLEVKR